MKIKNKKLGNVFLYAIIFINISLIFAYIVISKTNIFNQSINSQKIEIKLMKNVEEKAKLAIKYDEIYNQNGSGFIDSRVCPTEVSFSGTIGTGSIIYSVNNFEQSFDSTNNYIFCSGSSNSGAVKIFYTDDFLSFSGIEVENSFSSLNYNGISTISGVTYTGITFSGNAGDWQNSVVTFTGLTSLSNIDSNFNSDNYACSSTGTINYPNNFFDDDVLGRQLLYGYIEKNFGYYNIFWSNDDLNNFIANNTFNQDSYHSELTNTSSGVLKLDLDNNFSLKIIEFNKQTFNDSMELKKNNEWNLTSTGGIGYLSYTGSNLELSSNTGSLFYFDFKNKDYAVFAQYNGDSSNENITSMRYKIEAFDNSFKPIYISAVDNTGESESIFYGNDIIIDEGNYYYKLEKINFQK